MLATTKPTIAPRAVDPVITSIAEHVSLYGTYSAALYDQAAAEQGFGFESVEAAVATEASEALSVQDLDSRASLIETVPTTREGLFLYLEHLTSRMCFGAGLAPEHDEFIAICRTIEAALRHQYKHSMGDGR